MRRWERWWFQLMRNRRGKPPRARNVELPYLWAAHLLAWTITQHQRCYKRNTTKPPTGGFSDSREETQ